MLELGFSERLLIHVEFGYFDFPLRDLVQEEFFLTLLFTLQALSFLHYFGSTAHCHSWPLQSSFGFLHNS